MIAHSLMRKTHEGHSNLNLQTIGSVASFDEISEIITEFYQEWKHKEKIKSQTLKSLVSKLNNKSEESKDDNYLALQESTASDSLISNTQQYTDNSTQFKKRPKRRGAGAIGDLKDIL
jgi:hypothetical protein